MRGNFHALVGILLDIDNTLTRTSWSFFSGIAERFGVPAGETVEGLYNRYHYSWRVPHWQTDETARWASEQEWSNEFHAKMEAINGASDGVTALSKIVPVSAYVTTRPESMREVTAEWLSRHGFPDAPMMMRPSDILPKAGNQWKVEQIKACLPNTFGLVDDHADIVRGLSNGYGGRVFHFSANQFVADSPKILPCSDWGEVVRVVERCKESCTAIVV